MELEDSFFSLHLLIFSLLSITMFTYFHHFTLLFFDRYIFFYLLLSSLPLAVYF